MFVAVTLVMGQYYAIKDENIDIGKNISPSYSRKYVGGNIYENVEITIF